MAQSVQITARVYVRQFNGFIIATRCQDLTIGLKAVARTAMHD